MKGITLAGNLIVDYVKEIDSFPKQGMLANIRSVSRSVGGCAANTTIDLARMDSSLPLRAIGIVGDDENGEYVKKTLAAENIDISLVQTTGEAATSFTDVMNSLETGERTFFHCRGANALFGMEHIPLAEMKDYMVHVGYALLLDKLDEPDDTYGTAMARLLYELKKHGAKTSMDVVSEDGDRFQRIVTPALKYCDVLVVNEVEGERVTGIPARNASGKLDVCSVEKICRKLIELGVGELVVVHAPEGGCALMRGGEFACEGSYILPAGYIKGTVGAGDAFCAGILYSVYNGLPIGEALKIGAGAAACNLGALNSIDGMKPIAGIRDTVCRLEQRKL
jgi:sugar/nucleoside kinase (ribokinase family)